METKAREHLYPFTCVFQKQVAILYIGSPLFNKITLLVLQPGPKLPIIDSSREQCIYLLAPLDQCHKSGKSWRTQLTVTRVNVKGKRGRL